MAKISEERKFSFYLGMVLMGAGLLLFLSVFVTAATNFGDFTDFEARGRSTMIRAFGGMALIAAGGVLRRFGRMGAAGSGMVLDPEQAREDVKPWSKMAGGVVNDALKEVDAVRGPAQVVKVRCRACGALNEEAAKFCNQCAQAV